MKRWFQKTVAFLGILSILLIPKPAKADFWGGDVVVLSQILIQAIQQLIALKQIFSTAKETYEFMEDINRGISDALGLANTMNSTLRPGQFGTITDPNQMIRVLQELYGSIPKSSESKMQAANDVGAAEAMTTHNQAFQYAAQVDPEAERMKDYSRNVSPQGAGKLTAQSLAVLIQVSNQILRTNAAMLKVLGQNFALENKKEKTNSEHYKIQYEGISKSLKELKPGFNLQGSK